MHAISSCEGRDTFGKTCDAACIPGYTGPGAQCKCTKTGDWHCMGVGPGNGPKCTPVDCGKLEPVPGSEVSSTDTHFDGKNAQMTCKKGFEGGSKEYKCNEKGKWEPLNGHLHCTRNLFSNFCYGNASRYEVK